MQSLDAHELKEVGGNRGSGGMDDFSHACRDRRLPSRQKGCLPVDSLAAARGGS